MQWKAGLMEEPPDWQSIYRSTTLGLCPNPVFLSEWEVYSITHTLFYLTDFCGLTMHLPRDENQDVIKVLESLLIYYWKKADWDITGELLINMVALGRSNTSLFKTAALEFLRAWRLDGALPGPHFSLSNEVPDQKKLFENCYHTTLIGIFFADLIYVVIFILINRRYIMLNSKAVLKAQNWLIRLDINPQIQYVNYSAY